MLFRSLQILVGAEEVLHLLQHVLRDVGDVEVLLVIRANTSVIPAEARNSGQIVGTKPAAPTNLRRVGP